MISLYLGSCVVECRWKRLVSKGKAYIFVALASKYERRAMQPYGDLIQCPYHTEHTK
jgi:hypothetical protein